MLAKLYIPPIAAKPLPLSPSPSHPPSSPLNFPPYPPLSLTPLPHLNTALLCRLMGPTSRLSLLEPYLRDKARVWEEAS